MMAFRSRLADYSQFLKLRLSLLVVFSAVLGYLIAAGELISWGVIAWLALGGFLVTGASNGLNQIIERDTDALMHRTLGRPVPSGRMGLKEAWFLALVLGVSGLGILYYGTTLLSVQMGAVALLSYAFAYTPLKKVTPIAVFVGAFPGAMPVLIGYAAFEGHLNLEAGLLFLIQFFWQFPHFWSIAWVLHEDYQRAGFHLLPTRAEPQTATARIILWYTLTLLPFAMAPWWYGFQGNLGAVVCLIMTMWFVYAAWRLYQGADKPLARKLMFASFVYLPVVQLAYWLDAAR
ncbi:MAG: protoheme IX farnesyltransferase [Sphingomonadales bacterium]|nr:protoheme IX farnesyltransferase [Sphingomonadales bacterium]